MIRVTISEARDHLAHLGSRVALRGERIVVERRGRGLFALVPVEDVEVLERVEDKSDRQAIRRRLNESTKPLAGVRKELGL